MAKRSIPLPVPVIDPPEDEPRKCPPKGAPAWMATFADIATLLMAFFVLILSFAEFDQPRFKMVSGSLRDAFGIQRELPVMEMPQGTTILSESFSPSPDPAVIDELTQETTETEDPALETGDGGADGIGSPGETAEAATEAEAQAQAMAEAMAAALEQALPPDSPVAADAADGAAVLRIPPDTAPADLPGAIADAAAALAEAAAETGTAPGEVRIEGLAAQLDTLAGLLEATGGAGDGAAQAALAEAELSVALRQELAQGLVSLETREDSVVVIVGAGGAFPSGDAELTPEAREIMARIAFAAMGEAAEIVVTGHTDDVPVNAASPFRDNWGLAAARAASVVREMQGSGLVEGTRLTATSRGESAPVADNATPEGRAENRRIEIEIRY
jgi:chemotaxis protein MotB